MKISRTRTLLLFQALILVLVLSLSCREQQGESISAAPRGDQKIDREIDVTARLLAGREIPEDSSLHEFSKSDYYRQYSRDMRSAWKRFQGPNLEKIRKWWKDHDPSDHEKTVLYPFSGPDIMNALVFYPGARDYILFGLEQPGLVPDTANMNENELRAGLRSAQRSLETILRVNFFRTKGMAKNLKPTSFNSITGLILFFLSTNGYEIVDARRIIINKDSDVVEGSEKDTSIDWKNPPHARVPGIEISFRKDSSSRVQRLRYYMLNVIDYALVKHSPNFLPYLRKNGPYSTVIKSASYLMHNDNVKFTKIRKVILDTSTFLVQDDSGVPIRYLEGKGWDVKYHGYYDQPIPLFRNRFQADLKKKMKEESTGILPFSYGYDHQVNQSNLITAKKKQ